MFVAVAYTPYAVAAGATRSITLELARVEMQALRRAKDHRRRVQLQVTLGDRIQARRLVALVLA
jgi:hypothetical protein